jgi:hypothetical protein
MLTQPIATVVAAVLIVLGLLAHATVPRYVVVPQNNNFILRIDRWTGETAVSHFRNTPADWVTPPPVPAR